MQAMMPRSCIVVLTIINVVAAAAQALEPSPISLGSLRASNVASSKRLVDISAANVDGATLDSDGLHLERHRKRACRDGQVKQSLLNIRQGGESHGNTQNNATALCNVPEQIEEWKDNGLALKSTLTEQQLLSLGSTIDGPAYGTELHGFVDHLRSRFLADPGNAKSADYVEAKFKEYGLTTSREPLDAVAGMAQYLTTGKTATPNVVGRLEGTDLAAEAIVLGAHFDSVNWENTSGDSPGVDDNGSGVALVLLAAKKLAASPIKPRRTIIFVVFNAEEVGLIGSKAFAKRAKAGEFGHVKAAVIADEVAYPGHTPETMNKAIFETVGTVQGATSLLDTFAHCAKVNNGDGVDGFVINKHGFGSDHISFMDQGIPAMLLIERDNMYHADQWGHSARDTFEHADMAYGAAMTRLGLRVVATLASPEH